MCRRNRQVLSSAARRLEPGIEERLLALLRGRILPVALKSLRLWKRGDAALLASSSHAAQHIALEHV